MKTRVLSFMWRIVSILAVAAVALTGVAKAEESVIPYYVQLLRGTDSGLPPEPGSRQVGPRLAGKLQGVFKWKHYWELCQRKVEVLPGRKVRVRLANEREVEIDRTLPDKRTVTAFQNGQLVDRTVGPVGESMTLIGGDHDQASVWFIVVRRDKPGE